jgi:hypothetical protein
VWSPVGPCHIAPNLHRVCGCKWRTHRVCRVCTDIPCKTSVTCTWYIYTYSIYMVYICTWYSILFKQFVSRFVVVLYIVLPNCIKHFLYRIPSGQILGPPLNCNHTRNLGFVAVGHGKKPKMFHLERVKSSSLVTCYGSFVHLRPLFNCTVSDETGMCNHCSPRHNQGNFSSFYASAR